MKELSSRTVTADLSDDGEKVLRLFASFIQSAEEKSCELWLSRKDGVFERQDSYADSILEGTYDGTCTLSVKAVPPGWGRQADIQAMVESMKQQSPVIVPVERRLDPGTESILRKIRYCAHHAAREDLRGEFLKSVFAAIEGLADAGLDGK